MSQTPQEPSMEEILASIRRIISEDKKSPPKRGSFPQGRSSAEDDILELQNPLENPSLNGPRGAYNPQAPLSRASQKTSSPSFLSEETLAASREALNGLGRSSFGNGKGGNGSLEDVVVQALRPFLKEWLDTHLPALVKQIVREQVERITRSKM